jgi:hypothetical protein
VIRDIITISTAIGARLLIVILWITNHFGINPVKGGRPPNDSRDENIINFMIDLSLFVIIIWLMKDVFDNLIAVTTVVTSNEYIMKYMTHIFSPVIIAISIQPV